jgi:hypothetical protein
MSDDLVKRLRETTHFYQVDCELKMKCADLIEELEVIIRQLTEHNKSQAKPADLGTCLPGSVNDTAP